MALKKKNNKIKILDYMIAISFMIINVSIDSTGLWKTSCVCTGTKTKPMIMKGLKINNEQGQGIE